MESIFNDKGNEAMVYAKTFEESARFQVKRLIDSEPYSLSKIRIMPDAHAGKGCTVGTTMTIGDKITPNLVGVDIGCGMLTMKLKNKKVDLEKLDRAIRENVPSGFKAHKEAITTFNFTELICANHVDLDRAYKSLGSLGGGNHFIELSKSEKDGILYLIIHSGSRKLGGDTCRHYQNKAILGSYGINKERLDLIERLKSEGRESEIKHELDTLERPVLDKELAYLSGDSFRHYMNDMEIVQRYATVNREMIAAIICRDTDLMPVSSFETVHNYIDFKRRILRKGAVSAEDGEKLLVPINMRDGSLLCVGKGNPDWNYSAPHGAGRLMSRTQAKKNIDLEEYKETMKDVYSSSIGEKTLDEAPQAYKSIHEIRNAITETVDVIDVLKPIYNFKAQ